MLEDFYEKIVIRYKKRVQIKNFEDPRRKAIYSQTELSTEQKNEIDALYMTNFGEKIPHVWHRHYTAFTGNFDVNYFPESLYIPLFERCMNLDKAYVKCFEDKNILPLAAAAVGIKTPRTVVSSVKSALRNGKGEIISQSCAIEILNAAGDVFCKPSVDSSSGRGCAPAVFRNGKEELSGKSAEDFLSGLGKNFVIQERLNCHKSIADIYPGSVNTFRVITYRWKDSIKFFPVIMRIGSGGATVDNAHAGGMFIGVNSDGSLREKAFTEFKKEFTAHPDTNKVFADCRVEHFQRVPEAAEKMHQMLAQLGVINWDFTIDEEGDPVIIEANISGGSPWMAEMACGCGPFGENTAEILRWMKLMKNTPRSQRRKYEFGYNFE